MGAVDPDSQAIESAVATIIRALGYDLDKEPGLLETPRRVRRYLEDRVALSFDADEHLERIFPQSLDHRGQQMPVIVRKVRFASTCEHHMLPFFGFADVAYIPKENTVLGLSKFSRFIKTMSRGLWTQEQLTREIGVNLALKLSSDVMLRCTAKHTCMVVRGVEESLSDTVTMFCSGQFGRDSALLHSTLSQLDAR